MDLNLLLLFIIGFLPYGGVFCGELTFELPDNEKMCFHELIDKGVESTLEFQVNLLPPFCRHFISVDVN